MVPNLCEGTVWPNNIAMNQDTIEPKKQSATKARRRWAKGQSRPRYLKPDDLDNMMIMFVALMSEVSALRDRLDSHEAVADSGEAVKTAAVEAYRPDAERHVAREANRQAMLKRVFRAITEERDEALTEI